jgi:hypothetical protein
MTVWQGNERLVLASQSGARQLLLANAGIDFEAIPADIDERAAQQSAGLSAPADIAALLARAKAVAVSIKSLIDTSSAPIRRWRLAIAFSTSLQAAQKPQNSCAASPAAPTS